MAGAPEPQIALGGGHPYDAMVNDPGLTAEVGRVFKAAFGAKAAEQTRPGTPRIGNGRNFPRRGKAKPSAA